MEWISFVLLLAGAWLWYDSLGARETAVTASRKACETDGYLFLDDTVSIRSGWPTRSDDGQVRLRRVYTFEFSDTGDNRRRGWVTMVGREVETVRLDLYVN